MINDKEAPGLEGPAFFHIVIIIIVFIEERG